MLKSRALVFALAMGTLAFAASLEATHAAATEIARAVDESEPAMPGLPSADHVLVVKHERKLYLFRDKKVIAAFPVKLGHHPRGPKTRSGDGRTPEGDYLIDGRNDKSLFTLALHISYPNAQDRARAAKLHADPGGAIEIHGQPFVAGAISPAKLRQDWTAGCIALSNTDMQRVWDLVADGTPITIQP